MSGKVLWHNATNEGLVTALNNYHRWIGRQSKLQHALMPTYWANKLGVNQYLPHVTYLVAIAVIAGLEQLALFAVVCGASVAYYGIVGTALVVAWFRADGLERMAKACFRTDVLFDDDEAWTRLRRALEREPLDPQRFLEAARLQPTLGGQVLQIYLKNVELTTKRMPCGALTCKSAVALATLANQTAFEARRLFFGLG